MGNGKWEMGNGCGWHGATFELRLWAVGYGPWALKVSPCGDDYVVIGALAPRRLCRHGKSCSARTFESLLREEGGAKRRMMGRAVGA